jgi:DNA-binding PadR family transcriptional regulator
LAAIEQAVNNSQGKEIYTTIINDYELKHLQRLASHEPYLKYVKRESFKQELRRLRTLGFIESHPNKHISSIPPEGNLRDYVKITERGQEYLKAISNRN